MKSETLDALLIDRALGELAPETNELLEAYLAQTPAAAGQAEATVRTVAEARRTAVPSGPTTAPRFDSVAAALRREERRTRLRRGARIALRVAAGVVLGFGLGWLWFAPAPSPRRTALADHATAPRDDAANHFWSRENFVRPPAKSASPAGESEVRYHLRWASPVRKPQLEEIP
jgi:anti-sigma factor RsiW